MASSSDELAILGQQQDRCGGELLGDRGEAVVGRGRGGDVMLQVGHAEAAADDRLAVPEDQQRGAGYLAGIGPHQLCNGRRRSAARHGAMQVAAGARSVRGAWLCHLMDVASLDACPRRHDGPGHERCAVLANPGRGTRGRSAALSPGERSADPCAPLKYQAATAARGRSSAASSSPDRHVVQGVRRGLGLEGVVPPLHRVVAESLARHRLSRRWRLARCAAVMPGLSVLARTPNQSKGVPMSSLWQWRSWASHCSMVRSVVAPRLWPETGAM